MATTVFLYNTKICTQIIKTVCGFYYFRKGRVDIYLLGNRFIYDGVNSSRYNLSILRIDTDGLTSAEGSVEYSSSFFPAQNKRYITGVSRESAPLEFEVEIIGEEGYCSVHERAIKNWLFNSPTFKELYIDPEDDKEAEYVNGTIKRQYLECVFCNPEKIEYAEGTVGWRCTCMCSSTMAMQEKVEVTATSFSSDITLNVDTDIQDYVYPYLVITCGNTKADVTITNKSDNNRAMQIKDATAKAVLYADCAVGTIVNDANAEYYNKLVNQHFLRLVPGENIISVTGGVSSVKFTWNNARWMT